MADVPPDLEVLVLLQEAQQASETVQELAFDCLRQYRREALANPTEATVAAAQSLLKERLQTLLKTAREKDF